MVTHLIKDTAQKGAFVIVALLATCVVSAQQFTQVTNGLLVTDVAGHIGCAWGDFDNDGKLDLFVPVIGVQALYHNEGNGSFSRVGTSPFNTAMLSAWAAAWGDYDNDGHLDLLVADFGRNTSLLRNVGGKFMLNTNSSASGGTANGCAFGDYDNDGLLDFFIAHHVEPHLLLHNNGDCRFTPATGGILSAESGHTTACSWADHNNDGALDLFVTDHQMENCLYHNGRNGQFSRTVTPFSNDIQDSHGCTWGDYDNDGRLDLFVANVNTSSFLYHNHRDGVFVRTTNAIPNNKAVSQGCSWADYDNDGWLDLFVANNGEPSFLYHNNGDGTFTSITNTVLTRAVAASTGCAWGDYDNDGFADLFVANNGTPNFLFHNSGNSNTWITVRCIGAASNRSGIGAKVRVRAMIGGIEREQLREISGGGAYGGQNGLVASFGLAKAINISLIRIEWPSGTVQEMRDVAPRQFLTVREPPMLGAPVMTNGLLSIALRGGDGRHYTIQRSSALTNWTTVGHVTNSARTSLWSEMTSGDAAMFFRSFEVTN